VRGSNPVRATSYLRAIIPAASSGAVDCLLVANNERRWWSFDPIGGALVLREPAIPGDTELINLAVVQTLQHGGAAYVVEPEQMPDSSPLAAILRY
jgi:hypothetical protein